MIHRILRLTGMDVDLQKELTWAFGALATFIVFCLLYTSDAADE